MERKLIWFNCMCRKVWLLKDLCVFCLVFVVKPTSTAWDQQEMYCFPGASIFLGCWSGGGILIRPFLRIVWAFNVVLSAKTGQCSLIILCHKHVLSIQYFTSANKYFFQLRYSKLNKRSFRLNSLIQWFSTGEARPPGGAWTLSRGGASSLQDGRKKKNHKNSPHVEMQMVGLL